MSGQFETGPLKNETGAEKVKPSLSIVKSQSDKQNTPRLAQKGFTWRFVKAGGVHAKLQENGLAGRFKGLFCKKNKKLDSNFVSKLESKGGYCGLDSNYQLSVVTTLYDTSTKLHDNPTTIHVSLTTLHDCSFLTCIVVKETCNVVH